MARSRVGGTRGLLRGKVGDYIYQITRDATGQFAQNVYGYVQDPLNPSTDLQICARAAMACVERAMFSYYDVIYNAFKGKAEGTESINEFSRINYTAIRDQFDAYYIDEEFNEPYWDFPLKGNTMVKAGLFTISQGTLRLRDSFAYAMQKNTTQLFRFYERENHPGQTIGDFLSRYGMKRGDILDVIFVIYGKKPSDNFVGRFQMCVKSTVALNTVITSSNFKSILGLQTNVRMNANYYNDYGNFLIAFDVPDNTMYVACMGYACKLSRYDAYQWNFNNSQMVLPNEVYFGQAGWRTPYDVYSKWKNV